MLHIFSVIYLKIKYNTTEVSTKCNQQKKSRLTNLLHIYFDWEALKKKNNHPEYMILKKFQLTNFYIKSTSLYNNFLNSVKSL